jgi:hypothetical protein
MKATRIMLPYCVQTITDIQSIGRYLGYSWIVTHSGLGCRAGYLRVIEGHPWYFLRDFSDQVFQEAHRGIDYCGPDRYLDEDQAEGWWIGFRCDHYGDAPDLDLAKQYGVDVDPLAKLRGIVRDQGYVEGTLNILAQEAYAAAQVQIHQRRKRRKND